MRTIGEMSTDARILANTLKLNLIDQGQEVCAYDALTASIGRDVRDRKCRGLLLTARRAIERDHNVVLVSISNCGITMERDYGGYLDGHRKHIQKTTRRKLLGVSNAIIATPDSISNEKKLGIMTEMSLMGAVVQMTKLSAVKRLEATVAKAGTKELPTAETLRFFSNGDKNHE